MPRINLTVPFAQKDEAKRLGARWDGQQRVWYVPDGVDPTLFGKWVPELPDINIRASSYYILEATTICWKCGGRTHVYGFVLPSGHEILEPIEDGSMEFESNAAYEAWVNSPASSEWIKQEMPTTINYVDYLSKAATTRIRTLTPHFRMDFSYTTKSSYWMNHCECCGMKQGDFELHHEPRGAFMPLYPEDAAGMVLHQVDEIIEANCGGYSLDVDFFEVMQRK